MYVCIYIYISLSLYIYIYTQDLVEGRKFALEAVVVGGALRLSLAGDCDAGAVIIMIIVVIIMIIMIIHIVTIPGVALEDERVAYPAERLGEWELEVVGEVLAELCAGLALSSVVYFEGLLTAEGRVFPLGLGAGVAGQLRPEAVLAVWGVDLAACALDVCLLRPEALPQGPPPAPSACAQQVSLALPLGVKEVLRLHEEGEEMPQLLARDTRAAPGMRVDDSWTGSRRRAVTVAVKAGSHVLASAAAAKALSHVEIETDAGPLWYEPPAWSTSPGTRHAVGVCGFALLAW